MTLKDIVIQNFLNDENQNFTIYQTNFSELSGMYDKMLNAIKAKENWNRFLGFENAITSEGKIRFDRASSYFDKEKKQDVKTKVCFKYPVYNFLKREYEKGMERIKEKEEKIPLPV